MLSKQYRLTTDKDFNLVYKKGKKIRGQYGMLISLPSRNPQDHPRFGFVVGKKIGNAVIRHRHTRRLRHIVKSQLDLHEEKLKGKLFSYISYEYCDNYQDLEKELVDQIEKSIQ